ncbi:MAG: hypothetical protein ACOC1X_01020, partial [Promethearchaeota archaeon]
MINTHFIYIVSPEEFVLDSGNVYLTKPLKSFMPSGLISECNSKYDSLYYSIDLTVKPVMAGSLGSDANTILAQATQYAIMDYFGQHSFASTTAQMIGEMAYTQTITVASTIISMAVVFAGGALGKSLVKKSSEEVVKHSMKVVVAKKVAKGVISTAGAAISETFEEIYWDSQIEQWVEYKGDELGLTEEEKFYWSTLLTSLRESSGEFKSQLTSQIKSSLSSIRTQQTFNSWFSQLLSDTDLTKAESHEQFKQKIKDVRQQVQNADIRSREKTSFLKRLVEAGAVKGIALSLGSMFLGGFPLGAIFGLQTLIQVPFELGTSYLEDQIESATREHMWRQGALKAISELENQRQNRIQQAVLNQVKKSEIDMKQMEAIVEGARALPNTPINVKQTYDSALDKYANLIAAATSTVPGAPRIYLDDMGPKDKDQKSLDEFVREKKMVKEAKNMMKSSELLDSGGFKEFTIDEEKTVSDLLTEFGLSSTIFGVLVNGERVSTSYTIKPNEDKIVIKPHPSQKSPIAPTLQFDPKDQSLKFPLNKNDNEDTTLLKTILNILFKFREEIEEYHGTYEFRDELSWGRIGRLFGTKTNVMNNYLNVIQKTSTEQATFYIIEKTWLKFVLNIEDNFKEKYHIEPIYSLLDSALEQYAITKWGSVPWTLEIRQIFSTYSQIIFSESVLSERLGRGHDYVNKLKQKGKHEEYSKFFRFLVE